MLAEKLRLSWKHLSERSRLFQSIQQGEIDKQLYSIYLLETYHYTLHNARNQALVGVRALDISIPYLKFCLEHASEETGHEQMAIHDILSLGLKKEALVIPPPLPATEVLIAYLYWVSGTGNPIRRLGYSFWAESSYDYVTPLISRAQQVLGLTNAQMTFFIAHSKIDEEHAAQVRNMLISQCKSEQDWLDVERVMETSLRLVGNMMEEVYAEYGRMKTGQPSAYSFLKGLA